MVGSELDLLPDDIDWRDEGCEVFGSCLNCPLPRCLEEEPRGQQRLKLAVRNKRMVELRQGGKSVKDIAGLFGVSRRTVERALRAKSACHSEGVLRPCHSEGAERLKNLTQDKRSEESHMAQDKTPRPKNLIVICHSEE
ncbi:MAG: helix-turn-helix domain-containing protein [Dehalococcoidia bacterium]